MHATVPFLAVGLLALAGPLPAQTTFVEDSAGAGLSFTHVPATGHPMVSMASGAGVGDFNNDGFPDLYVPSGGTTPDRLFINDGSGKFTDEAVAWGLTDLHMGCGVAVGDYNRDGWSDIYVTSFGPSPGGVAQPAPGSNRLYQNTGNGSFVEVAAQAGVQFGSDAPDNFSCAWGDYDLDGWLDLMVMAYGPTSNANRLYHNEGDGTFTDVTVSAQLDQVTKIHGLAVSFSDMNGDRYPDLILIGDTGTSQFFENNRDGTFKKVTYKVKDLNKPNGMGIATGDFDRDGDFDFYVSDVYWVQFGTGGNRYFVNQGDHNFTEEGRSALVYEVGWGWGVAATDMDNDGWLDLAGTNGWAGLFSIYPARLFHNQGSGTLYSEVAVGCGFTHDEQGRALLRMDADQDGDEDIVITTMMGDLAYFRNDLMNGNSWIQVELDSSPNPALAPKGQGAVITAKAGGQTYLWQVDSNQSYLGQSDSVAHIGLGSATVVDELRVDWADGFSTIEYAVPVNQRVTITARKPFEHTTVQHGQMLDLCLFGAEPGETAYFLYSWQGFGPSNPIAGLGGMTADLGAPVHLWGTAVADPTGTAVYTAQIPSHTAIAWIYGQAVVPRGPSGEFSVKSNAERTRVLP